MSALLIPSLYVMSGLSAYAAMHHALAAKRRRVNRVHFLFAALSLSIAMLALTKAGAYQAQTVEALTAWRKAEVSAICLASALLAWFVAGYTGTRPRALLVGLSTFSALLFTVNLVLPYGVYYAELPRLSHYVLPWGERVTDLHVLSGTLWHPVGWSMIFAIMIFALYASIAQHRSGDRKNSRALGWALALFFVSILSNLVANLEFVEFIHLSDFGFIALLVVMDLKLMQDSRDQNRRMRDVLDHLPEAVCMKDLKGRFQLVNRGFELLVGRDAQTLLGKLDRDVFPEDLAGRFCADAKSAVETGTEVRREQVIERNGVERHYRSNHFPLLRPDGTAYAVCGLYLDITEAAQKDEALNKFRRQVWHADRVASTGAISASLAHEICQPLAAMLNNAQAGLRFLNQDRVDLDEVREILQDIVRDDKRAGTIINGLRAMLQKQETPYADLDLSQTVDEVVELLHSELIRARVEIRRALDAPLIVRGNKTQLQQVALNLIVNALEAMADQPDGERILWVTSTRTDGKAQVSLRDTGIGIASDMLDRVFEGFYTTKAQGLGVGLEVCRSIIESHRGSIWAESNPDRGATFHFNLPLAPSAAQAGPDDA